MLSVWNAAKRSYNELLSFSRRVFGTTALEPDITPKAGEEGFRQTVLLTCKLVLELSDWA